MIGFSLILLADLDEKNAYSKKQEIVDKTQIRLHLLTFQWRDCLFKILYGYSRPPCLISNSAIS
jgi:hypothetical protein